MIKKRAKRQNSITKTRIDNLETTHYIMKTKYGLPIDDKYVDVLITKLREWLIAEPEALRISQFCRFMGIPRVTFYRLCQDYPRLNIEYEETKLIFADRLLEGAVYAKKGMREGACLRYIHIYDPEFLEADIQASKAKQAETSTIGIQVVELEKFPDSPLVPEKKIES